MNKLNKIALLFASIAMAGSVQAQNVDNWRVSDGSVLKLGTDNLCWRDNFFTPATGVQGCDGVPKPAAPAPAPESTAGRTA